MDIAEGLVFGLVLAGIILVIIVLSIVLSLKKVVKDKKEENAINPIYIAIITFGILFLFARLNLIMIPITTILVGIIGNICNYKNKGKKYFELGIIVYSLMLIYGISYLYSM